MALESIDLTAIFGSIGVLLSVTACVAGVGWRTWSKWYDKIMAGEHVPFDKKFILQALGSLALALIVAMPLVTAGAEMINQWAGVYGLAIAWFLTAGWAYATNDGTNGIIKLVEGRAVTTAVKSGKLDGVIETRVNQILASRSEGTKEEESPETTSTSGQSESSGSPIPDRGVEGPGF